jgi:hypothetical protein
MTALPYIIFLIILIIIIAAVYWDNKLSAIEGEGDEFIKDSDMPWVPYHEAENDEQEIESKFASVSEDETETFLGENININKNNQGKGVMVHPVENYASSRGSVFART